MEISKKYKRAVKSAYIRETRLEEEMFASFLAEVTGINKGYLSDIEHGKRSPGEKLFQDLIAVFGVAFHDDESIVIELDNLIKRIYFQLMSNKPMISKEEFLAIEEKEYLYKNSIGYMKYNLLKLLIMIRKKSSAEEMMRIRNIIERNIDLLTVEQREIFNLCKILINLENRKYVEAQQQIVHVKTSFADERAASAFLQYLLVYCNFMCDEHVENILLCDKAARELSMMFWFDKTIDVLIVKGLTLYKMAKYHAAKELLTALYKNNNLEKVQQKVIKEYLIKIGIIQKDYLYTAAQLENFRREFSDNTLIFYEIFCNFKNENFHYLFSVKELCVKPMCEYYFYIACFHRSNKKRFIKYLAAALKRAGKDDLKKELLLELLLKEEISDADKIIHQKMYIDLLKNKFKL